MFPLCRDAAAISTADMRNIWSAKPVYSGLERLYPNTLTSLASY